MFKTIFNLQFLMAPEGSGGGTLTEDEIEKDDLRLMEEHGKTKEEKPIKEEKLDDADLLDDDDLLVDDKDAKEDKEEKDDKKDKEDEEDKEEDDEEVEEDDLDLTTNERNVDFKDLAKKFPELRKDPAWQELRNSYYREGKFTELFETVENAQEAAENNQSFIKLNNELVNEGKADGLFDALKEANPESLKKVSLSILNTIGRIDPNLYAEVITPEVKKLAYNMYSQGMKLLKRDKDSVDGNNLVATARNIAQWAFDDPDLAEKEPEVRREEKKNEKSDKEKELEEREQKIAKQHYDAAYNRVETSIVKRIDKIILDGLDPKDELSDFMKDSILEKVRSSLNSQLMSDKSHMQRLNSLWKAAVKDGYSNESLSRLVSASLERVKPIIPRLRNQYKAKALGRRIREDENRDNVRTIKSGRTGRPAERDGKIKIGNVDTKKIDYKNTSDDDLMSGKVKLRS